MNSAADILNPRHLNFEGDFDIQVLNLLKHVRLTAAEVRNLRNLFADLEFALQKLTNKGIRVLPFGSIVTGQGIKTSDVDCFIALPPNVNPNKNYVIYARNILKQFNQLFANVFAITTAKVPIVKFLHVPTNCSCDINFKSPAGVYNSELIGFLLHLDSNDRFLQLAILIKYWSKVHKMTGTNLLASYALTMLVIFYLQLMGIMPPIKELQRNVPPYMLDNWNLACDKTLTLNYDGESELYDLLGGFFKCYANMNFNENIISPYIGRLFNKKLFKNECDIPNEFTLYKENIGAGVCKPLNIDTYFCVQDPFEHARNTTAGVHFKLAERIKSHFQFASRMFDEKPRDQFLRAIFTEDTTVNMPIAKKKVKPVFHNKVVKNKRPPKRHTGVNSSKNLINCYKKIQAMKKTMHI